MIDMESRAGHYGYLKDRKADETIIEDIHDYIKEDK